MEIEIDKHRAVGVIFFEKTVWLLLSLVSFNLFLHSFDLEKFYFFYLILQYSLWFIVGYIMTSFVYNLIWLNRLEYYVEPDKLTETYEIITKTRNQARLQVVNDIDFRQSIVGRLFKLFNVTVSYGFGSESKEFDFYYLSEEQANIISDMIKVKGRIIDIK